jgi:tetratricopeptide (TPR) repeat protein
MRRSNMSEKSFNVFLKQAIILSFFFTINSNCFSNIQNVQGDSVLSRKCLLSGIGKLNKGNNMGALIDFEAAIENNSKNWEAYRYKGNAESILGMYEEALKDYTKALSINKKDALSFIGRGNIHANNKNPEEAINDYSLSIEINPKDPIPYSSRAHCYIAINVFNKAINDYSKCIELIPDDPLTYFKRGHAYFDSAYFSNEKAKQEIYRRSIKDFTRYIKSGGEEIYESYLLRGQAYLNILELDSGIADLKNSLVGIPGSAEAYKYLGCGYALKNDTIANQYFEASLTLNSSDAETYLLWGNFHLSLQNFRIALELYKRYIKKNTNKISETFFYHRGVAEASLGDTLNALDDFDKALKIKKDFLDVYVLRILFLFENLNYKDQIVKDLSSLTILLKDSLDIAFVYYLKSQIEFRTDGVARARFDIKEAIKMAPGEPVYFLVRACYKIFSSNYDGDDEEKENINDRIINDLDQVIALDPKIWNAYFLKAFILSKDMKFQEGCSNLKIALESGGRDKISKEMENFICKGKTPKHPVLTFPSELIPKLKATTELGLIREIMEANLKDMSKGTGKKKK